ncbi:hypothetical protein CapIbe_018350 [Capra ibex]
MPLGLRWSKSQSSESLRLNRPKVEPCAIAGKPLPAMKNSSTLKLQPLCPEVYTLIAAWLFLWETIQMQETTRNSKITHTATPSPTTSALSDPGTTPSTGGIFPGRGTCHIPNTCCTRCTANTLALVKPVARVMPATLATPDTPATPQTPTAPMTPVMAVASETPAAKPRNVPTAPTVGLTVLEAPPKSGSQSP